MAKIQLGGAGGAPTNNFIKSLRDSCREDYLIGTSCLPSDLFLADVDEKHAIPSANSKNYSTKMLALLGKTQPDFLHLQNDYEVRAVSRLRHEIEALGVKLFLPSEQAVEDCVNKQRSYEIWQKSGIRVPKTVMIASPDDLKKAFTCLGETIWLRAIEGGGGFGALPTSNYDFAKNWIDRFNGWGIFTASELLSKQTVTWQSIWHHGELVVAQTRRRRSWNFGDRTLSGVTGITGVGETCSIESVDQLAMDAIYAISREPNGIFSVDMTYDFLGQPNVTEINIGRFFTTHYFFTKAGLNFPEIYCDIALENKFPALTKKINPLPDGLVWIRGMDVEPVLSSLSELETLEASLC
jgi:hypothetical protein